MNETNGGPIAIGKNRYYSVMKLNDDNVNMSDKFKRQLVNESLYDNSYIGVITFHKSELVDMESLPIYGDSNCYITKHFMPTENKALSVDLRDKGLALLEQYYEGKLSHNKCEGVNGNITINEGE